MEDEFGVAVGLENGAAMLELAAPLGGVGEIAVVAERDFALVAIDHDGLRVEQRLVARGGVARVANSQAAGELREHAGLENFFNFAHRAMEMEFIANTADGRGGRRGELPQRVET